MSVALMSEVWKRDLPHAQMLVALALADHGDDEGGHIYPSQGRIAWKCGYTDRQVRNVLRQLEGRGLILKVAAASQHRGTEFRMDVNAVPVKPPYEPSTGKDFRAEEIATRKSTTGPTGNLRPTQPEEISAKPSVEPSEETERQAPASPVPSMAARAKPAPPESELNEVFEYWRIRCRNASPNITFTEARREAIVGRLYYDDFTVADLCEAIDGAALAIETSELDYEHKETELFQVVMNRERVLCWIDYARTGDYDAIQETYLVP